MGGLVAILTTEVPKFESEKKKKKTLIKVDRTYILIIDGHFLNEVAGEDHLLWFHDSVCHFVH